MRGQSWTRVILPLLPATLKEINANEHVKEMNRIHQERRAKKYLWEKPVNSMAYDTLRRFRRRGLVERDEKGVYRKVGK